MPRQVIEGQKKRLHKQNPFNQNQILNLFNILIFIYCTMIEEGGTEEGRTSNCTSSIKEITLTLRNFASKLWKLALFSASKCRRFKPLEDHLLSCYRVLVFSVSWKIEKIFLVSKHYIYALTRRCWSKFMLRMKNCDEIFISFYLNSFAIFVGARTVGQAKLKFLFSLVFVNKAQFHCLTECWNLQIFKKVHHHYNSYRKMLFFTRNEEEFSSLEKLFVPFKLILFLFSRSF